MNTDKILELAALNYGEHQWHFCEEDLIAFAQSVLEEEQEKYQELIAAAEAIVMTQDIYGGIPTNMIYRMRDVIERMKNDDR